jgi:hypothetical protein
VTYQGILHGQTCENVINFRQLDPSVTDTAIATAAERFWFFAQTVQSNQYTYNQMVIKRMTPIPLDEQIVFPVGTHAGGVSNAPFNNTIASVYTIRTGFSGKSHRGRFYLAGTPTSFSDDAGNTYNAAGAALIVAFSNNLLSEYGPSGASTALRMGVYSRVIGGTLPETVAGWQQMTRVDPQPIFGNQRRRRLGVGI